MITAEWTSTPPTSEGLLAWYWWRLSPKSHAQAVVIIRDGHCFLAGFPKPRKLETIGGEWWPIPIEPPPSDGG